jgi:hypothetical protein
MEWGILLGLMIAVLVVGAHTRLRRLKQRRLENEPGNIYPLW